MKGYEELVSQVLKVMACEGGVCAPSTGLQHLSDSESLLDPLSANLKLAKYKSFFFLIYCLLGFYTGDISRDVFLEETLNFISCRSEKTGKPSQK